MRDIPYGYCHCGCGEKTSVAPKTNRGQGQVKGEPNRFRPGHQNRKRTPQYEERDLGYETPCWFWLGAKDRLGYGLVHRGGCTTVAHKWHYECVHGPIPAGFELDHLCRQRSCVNPDHFEVVTHDENIRRGLSPTAINARKTHCNRGHEFTPENTYLRPDTGARECRTCKRAGMKAWWAANRSRPPAQSSGVSKL